MISLETMTDINNSGMAPKQTVGNRNDSESGSNKLAVGAVSTNGGGSCSWSRTRWMVSWAGAWPLDQRLLADIWTMTALDQPDYHNDHLDSRTFYQFILVRAMLCGRWTTESWVCIRTILQQAGPPS